MDNVYIPIGHGNEDTTKPYEHVVPPNSNLVILETCGRGHEWPDKGLPQHLEIKKFIKENPAKKHIFADPINHTQEINNIIGLSAYYTAGQKFPNLTLSLNLRWPQTIGSMPRSYRYSGLIPFETFISDSFTTSNSVNEIVPELRVDYKELYKYSILPIASSFPDFNSQEEKYKFLIKNKIIKESDPRPKDSSIDSLYDSSIKTIEGVNISLYNIMTIFPGTYYFLVCRGDEHPNQPVIITDLYKEELYKHRLFHMNSKQRKSFIESVKDVATPNLGIVLDRLKNLPNYNFRGKLTHRNGLNFKALHSAREQSALKKGGLRLRKRTRKIKKHVRRNKNSL